MCRAVIAVEAKSSVRRWAVQVERYRGEERHRAHQIAGSDWRGRAVQALDQRRTGKTLGVHGDAPSIAAASSAPVRRNSERTRTEYGSPVLTSMQRMSPCERSIENPTVDSAGSVWENRSTAGPPSEIEPTRSWRTFGSLSE